MNNPTIIPPKLSIGDHIRVIAPSRSLSLLSQETITSATHRLEAFGFRISFGKHASEIDAFNSSSIESRLLDLHDAFRDPDVDGILTAIGGYNSNQLIDHIDYELIKQNPKVICGFSDITTLNNAIFAHTGMVTYYGPHFSSWAMQHGFEYSQEHFVKATMGDADFTITSSETWSDDPWYIDQEARTFVPHEGYWVMREGDAAGRLIGGHGRSFGVLRGTKHWPRFNNSILLIEEDAETNPALFDRVVQSMILMPDFSEVKGILIGKFQNKSGMTRELLEQIITTKPELRNMPIIANVNFGHTTPIATLPIGGLISISAKNMNATISLSAE
jgi:muramoyltetrapeptide carboxypeptidase LdcA involved in peptidoglycan recycling